MFFRTALSALALTGLLTFSAQAVPLYNQAFLNNLGWSSQNDPIGPEGNFATVYENFTLSSDASITDLTWIGGYFGSVTTGTITGWTIQFYADDILVQGPDTYTVPGAVLATESFSGLANQTLRSGTTYDYSHTLATAVNLQAGVQYWVSIVPDLVLGNEGHQWEWKNGSGGDGRIVQNWFGSILPDQSPDVAFSLSGNLLATEAPELDPGRSTLPLAFVGCILGVLAGRRRVVS